MIINQPSMAIQEDLASMFAKNMTLSAAQQPAPGNPPAHDDRIVYISQHYTHSAHVIPQSHYQQSHQPPQDEADEPMQRPSSEPPRSGPHDLELLLRSHGVDASALSPPQLELFRAADDAQKVRLIQLWSICPPVAGPDNHALAWATTTVEQEEMLARRRFEQQQQQQQHGGYPMAEVEMSLDDGADTETTLGSSPATSMQSADGRWPQHHVEPYMQSGYEELARREYNAAAAGGYKAATDPVYGATAGMLDWERQQWMENRYGAVVAWRDDEEML